VTLATATPLSPRERGSGTSPITSRCQSLSWASADPCLVPWSFYPHPAILRSTSRERSHATPDPPYLEAFCVNEQPGQSPQPQHSPRSPKPVATDIAPRCGRTGDRYRQAARRRCLYPGRARSAVGQDAQLTDVGADEAQRPAFSHTLFPSQPNSAVRWTSRATLVKERDV